MTKEKRIVLFFRVLDSTLLGIFNLFRFLTRFLPPAFLCAVCDSFGYAIYYMRKELRDYVLQAMREALPEISDERKLKRIAAKAFASPFRTMYDLILLERYHDHILERLIIEPRTNDRYSEIRDAGKGGIVFEPHLGAVGIVTCLVASYQTPFTPLMMFPENMPVPRYLKAVTELAYSLGCDPENPVFWRGQDTIPRVREFIKNGGTVAITFDMVGGTVVDFFGRPTAIASGIAHFACDTNAPILPAFYKRGKGPLDYELIGYPDFTYTLSGDRSTDVLNILNQVVKQGEEMIRQAPEQWIGWLALRGWRKRAQAILEKKEGN